MTAQNNEEARRFEIPLEGSIAVLDYQIQGDTMVITHTEVPPALRGRGLAEILVRAALAWAGERRLKVDPQCSYVSSFIGKHPEFHHLRALA